MCDICHVCAIYIFIFNQGPTAELELIKGKTIRVSTDKKYEESCDEEVLYLDYKNITKVVKTESRIYIDDGLISLIVKSIGE